MPRPSRPWLILPAGISLLAGLDAALLLAGLPAPVEATSLPDRHGVLMTLGFLGTLIALERAVALRTDWAYAAPGLLGAGGIMLAVGAPHRFGAVLLIDGCLALLAVYAGLYLRQRDECTAVQALAAVCATGATVLWTRLSVADLLLWLVLFVVLTIAAERVELARLHLGPRAPQVLLALALGLTLTAMTSVSEPDGSARAAGILLLVLTTWLTLTDVARHTIHGRGLPRLSAAAMLGGYGWLMVAGATWAYAGRPTSTAGYDTVVHATFLGFGMSMVIAHAGVILPAIVRRPLPYRPFLWTPLALLHTGMLARVAGSATGVHPVWSTGAWLTVLALLALPVVVLAGLFLPNASKTPGRTHELAH